MIKRLAIVVPCYNEEEALVDTNAVLNDYLKSLIKKKLVKADSFILYVNDGSKDRTWEVISEAHKQSKYVYGLNLAGNKGHQNALLAGLMQVKDEVDMTVSIDADLQDDVNAIEEMIKKYYEGCDIVYGVRNDRTSDSFFKKFTAESFYKIMNWLGTKTVYNSADFRLMSNRALDELSLYSEQHLFLRGIATELGFKTDCVYYKRNPRLKGESKYPLKKMMAFAFDGVTSFSDKPLTLIMVMGFLAIFFSFLAVIYSVIRHFTGHTIQGWTSLFVSIWFLGGVQLVSLGIIGKYVGKTFIETKKRPRYYVESYLNHDKKK
ncbi:MAG: glycosyltransferase family 2 protein [Erysipelotrichaceae bacterium]|nr:glycosyltransferase family 2 protein [Erysipelotrichaceae bacterium]